MFFLTPIPVVVVALVALAFVLAAKAIGRSGTARAVALAGIVSVLVGLFLWQANRVRHEQALRREQAHLAAAEATAVAHRVASDSADAIMQLQPPALVQYVDGGRIESYDNGLRVRVSPNGVREILATPHAPSGPAAASSVHSTHRKFAVTWVLVLPAIVLLAWALLKSRRGDKARQSTGLGLSAMGALLLLLVGGFFSVMVGSRRVEVAEVRTGNDRPLAAGDAEAAFEQLTAPRIELDEPQRRNGEGTANPSIRSAQVPEQYAAAVRELVEDAIASKSADEDVAATEAAAPPSGVRQLGKIAKDAVIIMWVGDPPPWEALRADQPAAETADSESKVATSTTRASASAGGAPAREPVVDGDAASGAASTTARSRQLRPEWLEGAASVNDGSQRQVLSTPPYQTASECRDRILIDLQQLVIERTKELLRIDRGGEYYVPRLELMGLSIRNLSGKIVQEEFVETIDTSVGPMKRLHALVQFPPTADQELLEGWRSYARQERMAVVGAISSGVVGVLALVFGLLKLDTWTRGYYSKRLFLGVPAAIIALLALLAVTA